MEKVKETVQASISALPENNYLEKQRSSVVNDNGAKKMEPADKVNAKEKRSSAVNDNGSKKMEPADNVNVEEKRSSADNDHAAKKMEPADKVNAEEKRSYAVNDNAAKKVEPADNVNVEEKISSADNDNLGEQKPFADSGVVTKQEIKSVKIKSLADLIGFCRDKGLQVYNDTSNVPEVDRVRMEALGEQGGSGTKKHRSDHRDPSLTRRSGPKHSGKNSLDSRNERTSSTTGSATTKLDVTSRKTSAVPSASGRSRTTSRMSSALSTYEIQSSNKDAEELMQQRMRRRSKRRRETKGHLVDLITEVGAFRKKSNMMLTTDSATTENPDSSTTKNPDSVTTDNPESLTTENPDSATTEKPDLVNGLEDKAKSNVTVNDNANTNSNHNQEAESAMVNGIEPETLQSNDVIDEPNNAELPQSDNTVTENVEPNNSNDGDIGVEGTVTEKRTDDAMEEVHNGEAHVKITERSKTMSKSGENVNAPENVPVYSDTNDIENRMKQEIPILESPGVNNQHIPKQEDIGSFEEQELGNDIETERKEDMNYSSPNEVEQGVTFQNANDVKKVTTSTDVEHTVTVDGKRDMKVDSEISGDGILVYNISSDSENDKPVNRKLDITVAEDSNVTANGTSNATTDDKRDISIDQKCDSSPDGTPDASADGYHDKRADGEHDISANVDSDINSGEINSTTQRTSKSKEPSGNTLSKANVNNMEEENDNDSEKVIEEVRIKDGNSTLVLYKVKEKSLLSLGKNTDNVAWKEQDNNRRNSTNNESPESKRRPHGEQSPENEDTSEHDDSFNDTNSTGETASDENETNTDQSDVHYISKDDDSLRHTILSIGLKRKKSKNNISNSESLYEDNGKIELCEDVSEIHNAEHDGNMNINENSFGNTETMSKNNNRNDRPNKRQLNSAKSHEKLMNGYTSDGDDNFNTAQNLENVKTLIQTMHSDITGTGLDMNIRHSTDVDLEKDEIIIGDKETGDMAESGKEEMARPEKGIESTDSKNSENERMALEDAKTDKGQKQEIRDNEVGEQASQSSSKKGMTAEEWLNFLTEINRKKTSIASEKMLSADARLIYLMEKTKKTNTDYSKEHVKTIILFEEARGVFRTHLGLDDGNRLKRNFAEENSTEENTEIEEKENQADTQENDVAKDEENLKDSEKNQKKNEKVITKAPEEPHKQVKPKKKKVKQAPKLSEDRLRDIRDKYWSRGQGNSEIFEFEGEEYYIDPNGELVKAIKFNASKKIDTRWDPNHPMFKKMSDKNKAFALKGLAPAMKHKTSKISTDDIPTNNVYVEEAKRIYPKGFEDVTSTDNKTSAAVKKVKKAKNAKTKSVDIGNTGQEDTGALTKIETTDNDKPVKRKLKKVVSVPNKMGVNDNAATDESMISTGEITKKRKSRKTKSVSSKHSDSEGINETEEIKASREGKKKQVRIIKRNNIVQADNDNTTDTAVLANTENKTVIIKRKRVKKTKPTSDKEFEADHVFISEQNQFIEKTAKLNKIEKSASSKETIIRKPSNTLPQNSLPELEFKSKDEERDHSRPGTHTSHKNTDIGNQSEKEDEPTDTDPLLSSKSSKQTRRKHKEDDINALKIFKEAREDLDKDLSIVNDTAVSISQNAPTNKLPLANGSISSVRSGKSDVSISAAVDVVQSRSRFYNDQMLNLEKSVPREHRVYRLFREIQMIRRNAGPFSESTSSLADPSKSVISDPTTGFLFLNYGRNQKCYSEKRTSNCDLKRFLYGSLDYEVCSKVKCVNSSFRRRVKAFDILKEKMYTR